MTCCLTTMLGFLHAVGFDVSMDRRSRGWSTLCARRCGLPSAPVMTDARLRGFGTAACRSCWTSRIRRNVRDRRPSACISTTNTRFCRCRFRRLARGSISIAGGNSSSFNELDRRMRGLLGARPSGEWRGLPNMVPNDIFRCLPALSAGAEVMVCRSTGSDQARPCSTSPDVPARPRVAAAAA